MEDEIDLRRYVDVVLRHWKLIAVITIIAVVVAAVLSFPSPSVYEAKSSLLINRSTSNIVFAPQYPTSDKDFRQALVGLVKSSSVASAAIEQLGDKLEPQERNVADMLDKVEVTTNGDLIEILVKSTDAEKATAIANAWADSYESYINGSQLNILQTPEKLQAQADVVKGDYVVKQKALEDFLDNNSIDKLSDQIADRNQLIDIESLRQQLESGALSQASSTANSLSLILLQTKAFTSLPLELQLSLEGLLAVSSDKEEQLHDIDALISTLETRSEIKPGLSVSELRQEILQLQRNLDQENAKKKELQKATDTAWQAYTTLDNKVIEAKATSVAQNVVVRVASPAVVPTHSVPTHKVTNIVIALVLGLIVGVFGAFGAEYFKKDEGTPSKDEEIQQETKPDNKED